MIAAKLGEGGMGVVFRAKDSQLGREVALKVPPEAFSADPERASRFEREAKLQLNLSLSRDGRTLSIENEILDSDVWLLEYR